MRKFNEGSIVIDNDNDGDPNLEDLGKDTQNNQNLLDSDEDE